MWYHEKHKLHDENHHQHHSAMDICVPIIIDHGLRDAIERAIDAPWKPNDPRDSRTQLADTIEAEIRGMMLHD